MDVDPKQEQEAVDFFNALHPPWLEGRAVVLLKREAKLGRAIKKTQFHIKDEADFRKHIPQWIDANQNRGYAVFLSVMRYTKQKNGKWGTKKTDVIPGRDVMWDDDRGLGKEKVLANIKAAGYPSPSFMVESSQDNFHGHYSLEVSLSSNEAFVQIQEGFTEKAGTCGGVHLLTQKIRIPGPFLNMKPKRNGFRVRTVESHPDLVFNEDDFYKTDKTLTPDMTPDEYAMEHEPGSMSDHTRNIIENGIPAGEDRRPNIHKMQMDMVARGVPDEQILEESYRVGRDAGLSDQELEDMPRSLANAKAKNPVPGFAKDETAELVMDHLEVQTIDESDLGIDAVGLPPWPSPPELALSHGLLKELTARTRGHTEAGSAALAFNFLVDFGSVVGDRPHFIVEEDRHHCNLFLVIIGVTSGGRKGVTSNISHSIFKGVDGDWFGTRQLSSISTGEGLIQKVQDPEMRLVTPDATDLVPDPQPEWEEVRPGVIDKRLNITCSEFAQSLKVASRPGNQLGGTLRDAWDSKPLENPNKNSPQVCQHPHVSLTGHATFRELSMAMTADSDIHGGTFNRVLWCLTRREVLCPQGGFVEDKEGLQRKILTAVTFARNVDEVKVSDDAWELFDAEYIRRNSKSEENMAGALIARADPQVRRLAMILALTRCSDVVEAQDMAAALDLWEYAEASARRIFSPKVEKVDLAVNKLVEVVRTKPGLSKTDLRNELKLTKDKNKAFNKLLAAALASGEIDMVRIPTKGADRLEFHPVMKTLPVFSKGINKPLFNPYLYPEYKKGSESKSDLNPERNGTFSPPNDTSKPLFSNLYPLLSSAEKSRLKPGDSAGNGTFDLGGSDE